MNPVGIFAPAEDTKNGSGSFEAYNLSVRTSIGTRKFKIKQKSTFSSESLATTSVFLRDIRIHIHPDDRASGTGIVRAPNWPALISQWSTLILSNHLCSTFNWLPCTSTNSIPMPILALE